MLHAYCLIGYEITLINHLSKSKVTMMIDLIYWNYIRKSSHIIIIMI